MLRQDGLRVARTLLIEDDHEDIHMIEAALKRASVANRPDVVTTGEAGLSKLREAAKSGVPYDLIWLDLNMPGMNGYEFLDYKDKDPLIADVPVVVLTTSQSPTDIRESYRRNAVCYLAKPLDITRLIMVVNSIDKLFFQLVVSDPHESSQPVE